MNLILAAQKACEGGGEVVSVAFFAFLGFIAWCIFR